MKNRTKNTGNYTVSGDKIAFIYKSSEVSSDSGKTWSAGKIPPAASFYYELGTDNGDRYLIIGSEDATLPLDMKTNAVKYEWMEP